MLAGGREATSPQEVAAQERSFERQLRRDALRKRVMMRMVPHPEQVWPRGGIKTVEAWFAFLSLPTGCHPCHTCASPSTIALLPIHYPTSPPQNR